MMDRYIYTYTHIHKESTFWGPDKIKEDLKLTRRTGLLVLLVLDSQRARLFESLTRDFSYPQSDLCLRESTSLSPVFVISRLPSAPTVIWHCTMQGGSTGNWLSAVVDDTREVCAAEKRARALSVRLRCEQEVLAAHCLTAGQWARTCAREGDHLLTSWLSRLRAFRPGCLFHPTLSLSPPLSFFGSMVLSS
ncbi:hypothetical protein AN958_11861 [Leucoagaricus sp. SymC.cos]|nr:hypothetical protein AN958_11861 [Leucoagaricus sp. SymC.cos]